jgi:pyruvate/2-oxoglutarate dehydrogenase complex dihydrolipoamide dehydrogenase (E3) component
MPTTAYDAIVIGTGQAGGPLATALGAAGKRTAIIERSNVGGTCINVGCTPTKTMVASARVAYLARRGSDYGVRTGPVSVDLEVVRRRKRDIVASFRGSSERRLLQSENVDLTRGEARFRDSHAVEVTLTQGSTVTLEAPLVFINTGARNVRPRIEGLDTIATLDNASIMELDRVPEHLLVLGGGYIGLEFGQMFRRFGSRVTIVQRASRLLPREDPDVAEEIAGILAEDGVSVLLEATTTRVQQTGDELVLTVRQAGAERVVTGSHLLVATGRAPDTAALDLPAAGITTDERGYIQVDDRLETTVPGVYALGDVKPGPAFTHISYDDFRVVRTNLLEQGAASIRDRIVPYTVFTDPQLGRVGMTESEARAAGHEVRVAMMPMTSVARALEAGETRGLMKVVVDRATDRILGAAVLGLEGGEIMAVIEVAMMGELPYTALRNGVFAHPTLAESLNNVFGSFRDDSP